MVVEDVVGEVEEEEEEVVVAAEGVEEGVVEEVEEVVDVVAGVEEDVVAGEDGIVVDGIGEVDTTGSPTTTHTMITPTTMNAFPE